MYSEVVCDALLDGHSSGFILSNFQTNQTFKRNLQHQEYVPSGAKEWDYTPFQSTMNERTPSSQSFNASLEFESLDFSKSTNESFVVVNVNEPFNILYASQGWLDMMQCSAEELETKNLCWIIGGDMSAVRPLIAAHHSECEAVISFVSRTGKTIRTKIHASATSEWNGVLSCTLTMQEEETPCGDGSYALPEYLGRDIPAHIEPEQGFHSGWQFSDPGAYTAPQTPTQTFHRSAAKDNLQQTLDESPVSVTQHSFFWVPPLDEARNKPSWQSTCEDSSSFQYAPSVHEAHRPASFDEDETPRSTYTPCSPPSPLKRSRAMMSDCYPVPALENTEPEVHPAESAEASDAVADAAAKKAKPAPRSFLRLVPRRKGGKDAAEEEKRGGCGKAVELTREKIEDMAGKSLKQAAAEMGLAASTLKKACRRIGIERWPHRPETVTPQLPPSLLYDSAYVRRLQCKYSEAKSKGSPKADSPCSPLQRH